MLSHSQRMLVIGLLLWCVPMWYSRGGRRVCCWSTRVSAFPAPGCAKGDAQAPGHLWQCDDGVEQPYLSYHLAGNVYLGYLGTWVLN